MLQFLLWLPLLLHATSADFPTCYATHYANALKLRCDALPYRTVYHNASCYFAIDAGNNCSRVLLDAKLIGEAPDPVWTTIHFPNQFVRDGDSTGKKRALCLYESRFPKVTAKSTTKAMRKCKRVPICGPETPKISYALPHPWRSLLKDRITPGQTFIFRGRTFAHSVDWNINFHSNAAIWTNGHDAPLHISFRHDMDRVRFFTFQNGNFIYEEYYPMPDTLKSKAFEIRIRAHENSFQMFVNDKEIGTYNLRLPMASITRVSSMGGAFSFLDMGHSVGGFCEVSHHYVHLGEKYDPVPNEIGITKTGFSFCKTLYLTGMIEQHVPRVSINFLRKNETASIEAQNALHFNPRFDLGHLCMDDAKNGKFGGCQILPLPFSKGVYFNLTIVNEQRGFVILVNGKQVSVFIHRSCPLDITSLWIAQIADLTATVSHSTNCDLPDDSSTMCADTSRPVVQKTKLTYVLPHPWKTEFKERISPGQNFIFQGRTFAHSRDWNINFHSNAAVWANGHDAPLHISFRHDVNMVRFFTFQNGNFIYEENYQMPDSLKNKAFDIRIRANEDNFQMFINNKEFATYNLRLPMSSIKRISSMGGTFSFLDLEHGSGGFSEVAHNYVHLGEKYEPVPNESGITTTGFSYCKTLYITGIIEAHVHRVSINFNRKNVTGSLQEENALHFNPRFDLNHLCLDEARNGRFGGCTLLPLPFTKGVPFNLTIANEPRGFVITVDGKYITTFTHRICPDDITTIWIGSLADLTATVSNAANCEVPKENSGICAK